MNDTPLDQKNEEQQTSGEKTADTAEQMQPPAPDPIDCVIHLDIRPGKLEVYAEVDPPQFGGADITAAALEQVLAANGVTYGIDKNKLAVIEKRKYYDGTALVAKGLPAVNGADGTVKNLYPEVRALAPKQNPDGTVDYRDLGLIENIKQGTVLCEITLPTQGTEGIDVTGRPLLPKPGKPARIPNGQNTQLSPDGLQLVATADGNLAFRSGLFHIDTVFKVEEDVDTSTGNIIFIGEVIVRGNVSEGFMIKADKGVTVHGMVGGAVVESQGPITIKSGAVNSTLNTKQVLQCGFAENCKITTIGDLKANSLVNCTVTCGGELQASGNPGTIMGGFYTVGKNVTANSIGAKSYIQTNLIVGNYAAALGEKTMLEQKVKILDEEIYRLAQAATYLQDKKKLTGSLPPDREEMLTAAIKAKVQKTLEKGPIMAKIKEIENYIEEKPNLFVSCRKTIFPGVRITINDFVLSVQTEYNFCKLTLGDDGIAVRPL